MNDFLNYVKNNLKLLVGDMPMTPHGTNEYKDYWQERENTKNSINEGFIKHRFEQIAAKIPDGARVLDIGCGDGSLLAHIAATHPRCHLEGIDLSDEAVKLTAQKGFKARKFDLIKDGVESLEAYDYIIMAEVIEHVPNPEELVLALKSKVKIALIVTTPNVAFILYRFRLFFFGKFPATCCTFHIREHLSFWSFKDFRFWASYLGFNVKEMEGVGGIKIFGLNRLMPNLFAGHILAVIQPR